MTGRWRWLVLVAVLVASVAAALVYQSQRPPYGYEPTGDELYDRFALIVLKQQSKNPYYEVINNYLEAHGRQVNWGNDYSALAEWESEYSNDPRYWQLRWLCEQSSSNPIGGRDLTREVVQKIEEGVVDEGSYTTINYCALHKANPTKTLELIEQAITFAPENAHFHYVQAILLQEHGDDEGAFDALRRGNNAPRNDPPRAYPLDLMTSHFEYFDSKANQVMGGVLLGMKLSAHLTTEAIPSKQLARDLLASYKVALPLDVADDLLAYARRYGERSDSDVIRMLTTVVLMELVLDRIQTDSSVSTPEQKQKLQELIALRDKLKNKVSAYVKSRPQQAQVPISPFQSFVELWDDEAKDRAFIEAECLPILEEMAKIKLAD
jgi:tetratricopeptide (TPR) repeat protein